MCPHSCYSRISSPPLARPSYFHLHFFKTFARGAGARYPPCPHNGYCDDGYDPEYLKNKACLDKIDSPSGVYYGYKITVGPDQLLGATGGLRTNAQMQVCDENDEPIEGLYNIGVMVGDMYANTYNFCICGHNLSATCTTFPYLLAQDFADMA